MIFSRTISELRSYCIHCYGLDGGSGASGGSLSPHEIDIIPEDDVRFSITGNGNSLLIIDVFAPELNGTVIFCRDEIGRHAANFTLRSTRELTSLKK